VLWSSDLRGFTERSDRLPSERMIAILNALFEAQAAEIRGHGGEILKFIGDGLLAIFPIAETDAVAAIAKAAVAAARYHPRTTAIGRDPLPRLPVAAVNPRSGSSRRAHQDQHQAADAPGICALTKEHHPDNRRCRRRYALVEPRCVASPNGRSS